MLRMVGLCLVTYHMNFVSIIFSKKNWENDTFLKPTEEAEEKSQI